ncbi:MAG: ParB/RepB/Spo0J family partition protein [Eubacteriales bacterium]
MEYKSTLSSALEFGQSGRIEEWIHAYLLSDGHNKPFSDGLKLCDRFYIGPLKMPLSMFTRCCGPEEDMKWRVDPDLFEKHVSELMEIINSGVDIAPMIVNYVDGGFVLNDGNHRFEAYSRLGTKEAFVIVWITDKSDFDNFTANFSLYLD